MNMRENSEEQLYRNGSCTSCTSYRKQVDTHFTLETEILESEVLLSKGLKPLNPQDPKRP